MITEKKVIDLVYLLLKGKVSNLYKISPPDDSKQTTYTVINTLGVPRDPIQEVTFNVNCYTDDADKARGIPDLTALNTMAETVISTLENYNNGAFDIEYQFGKVLREQTISKHFVNNRFRMIFLSN